MRVLVVDDGGHPTDELRQELLGHGVTVDVARSESDALGMAASASYAAVVLDVMTFRHLGERLVERAAPGGQGVPALLRVGDLELDPAARRVRRGDTDVALSATEYAVLYALMVRPGEVLDRHELMQLAWRSDRSSNVVDVYISYLRQKVDRPFGVRSIETVRGTGYRLRPDGGRP